MTNRVIWRHHFSLVGKMPAVVMQFVSHPRPGSDLATILQLAKDGATLWRKHGASLKLGARLIPPAPGLPRYGHFIPPRDGADPVLGATDTSRVKSNGTGPASRQLRDKAGGVVPAGLFSRSSGALPLN
ncbi:hypothetical protein E4K65_22980 [Bradyrhizobium niftali]|uniref:Uncharacterized protein n=1 Tax=Bradyrhizobium niftali TaxID=2560055 RepID=A0A4Y9LU69_9BRAD|nr:hypothetical protein E4K65_22980 [Bradyrhizobium niftali]